MDQDELLIQEGVTVTVDQGTFKIKGPKGETQRTLYAPGVLVEVEGSKIIFKPAKKFTLQHKRLINTYKAHLINNFKGVTQGHTYLLKICSGHFPMNVAVKNNALEVKNLLGETIPRIFTIPQDVSVKVEGDQVVVTGADKEKTAQCAASIEQLTRRPGFDKRVFQDGIYLLDKDGKRLA